MYHYVAILTKRGDPAFLVKTWALSDDLWPGISFLCCQGQIVIPVVRFLFPSFPFCPSGFWEGHHADVIAVCANTCMAVFNLPAIQVNELVLVLVSVGIHSSVGVKALWCGAA